MAQDYWVYDNKQQHPHDEWFTDGGGSSNLGWTQFDYAQTASDVPVPPSYYSQHPGDYSSNNNDQQFLLPTCEELNQRQYSEDDYDNEPPLLDELGINFSHIRQKTVAVLNPRGNTSIDVIEDQDLAGPLVFCLLFGAALLLHGKLSFGHIYGIGGMGCVGMYTLMNLMAPPMRTISFTCTASVLGYCLLPMALLSLLTAALPSENPFVYLVTSIAVLWCTSSSSKLFVTALSMDHQRILVAYPCFLLYLFFALLALF